MSEGARDLLIAIVAATLWVCIVRPGPLSLPYFWDEADVYVPGALWLAENGLDFRPGVFPEDWSRGHPPLLYFVSGVAFKTFGAAPIVGHLLVLPFAILALVCTWMLGNDLYGRHVGAVAALLLGCTPLFMTMANMLLPEMFLTGITALAMLLFARGHLVGAALCGCALVLIKETGVFVPATLTGAVLWQAWRDGALANRKTWSEALLMAAPVAVLVGFFVWQKALAGYYVFPHHAGMLRDRTLDPFTVLPSMFAWHGRWILTLGAAWGGYLLWKSPRHDRPPVDQRAVAALVLLVIANGIFFAKMFWLERYVLPAHPGLMILAVGLIERGVPLRFLIVLPFAVGIGLNGLTTVPGADEAELTFAYADVIESHQLAFAEIPPDAVVLTTWPMTEELRRPEIGFVEAPVEAVHARHLEDSATPPSFTHALIAVGSPRASAMQEAASGLKLLGTYRVGNAPQAFELYGP
ncbi:MAG: hypothetical protein GY898_00450 [Proteobacteria bacterium]|nr:hypothetical protein [Pseudomonadota bacterium]